MPLQGKPAIDDIILERHREFPSNNGGPDPEEVDNVMLIRSRISRIFYRRKFFDYPISLSYRTVSNLGLARVSKIIISYLKSRAVPVNPEETLEDFFINRFGRELYLTFFRDYIEKLWGIPCDSISSEWGAQRIKGLSITKAVLNAASRMFNKGADMDQKKVETSLIETFLYPKLGPGQIWEKVADIVQAGGGEI